MPWLRHKHTLLTRNPSTLKWSGDWSLTANKCFSCAGNGLIWIYYSGCVWYSFLEFKQKISLDVIFFLCLVSLTLNIIYRISIKSGILSELRRYLILLIKSLSSSKHNRGYFPPFTLFHVQVPIFFVSSFF